MPNKEYTQERLKSAKYAKFNAMETAPVRRKGKHVNITPARAILEHEIMHENDPEALSIDFLCGMIESMQKPHDKQ